MKSLFVYFAFLCDNQTEKSCGHLDISYVKLEIFKFVIKLAGQITDNMIKDGTILEKCNLRFDRKSIRRCISLCLTTDFRHPGAFVAVIWALILRLLRNQGR
jgi:hypothetical protein